MALAGVAGEQVLAGDGRNVTPAGSDRRLAIAALYGTGQRPPARDIRARLHLELDHVTAIVRRHWSLIERIAAALVERRELDTAALNALVAGYHFGAFDPVPVRWQWWVTKRAA
jgi:hypothetical protein